MGGLESVAVFGVLGLIAAMTATRKPEPQEQPKAKSEPKQEPKPKSRFCTNCGAGVRAGDSFCSACGQEL